MACREQLEHLETRVTSDHRDRRDCREPQVLLVPPDKADLRARLASRVQPGQRVRVARKDPSALPDSLDRRAVPASKAELEQLDIPGSRELSEQLEPVVTLATVEQLASLGPLEVLELLEMLGTLEQLERQEARVSQAPSVKLVHLATRDKQESRGRMDRRVLLVIPEILDLLVAQVHLARLVLRVQRVKQVSRGQSVQLDNWVLPVKLAPVAPREPLATLDHQDSPEHLVTLDHPELLDFRDLKVPSDHLVKLEQRVSRARLDSRGPVDPRDRLVLPVLRD